MAKKKEVKEEVSKNLELWDKVSKTDPEYTKETNTGGYKFTSIDAQYQISLATEQFGEYGKKWGFKEIELKYDLLSYHLVIFKGIFFFPDGEFPIINSCKLYMNKANTYLDDNFAKKIETDSLTKALAKLGFNADVFMGKFDDHRYVNQMKEEFNDKKKVEKEKEPDKVSTPPINTKKQKEPGEFVSIINNFFDNIHKEEKPELRIDALTQFLSERDYNNDEQLFLEVNKVFASRRDEYAQKKESEGKL